MPKVTYTSAKGLFQESGAGEINLSGQGVLKGHLKKVQSSIVEGVGSSNLTASMADAGTTFIIGGKGGKCVALPEATSGNVGFNCRLVITGALSNTIRVTCVDGVGLTVADHEFLLNVEGLGARPPLKIGLLSAANNHVLTASTGCADADDASVIDIVYIDTNKVIAKATSLA